MSIQYSIDANGRTVKALKIIKYADVVPHKRARISQLKPAGYHAIRKGNRFLLHRCHIIADQLTISGAADPRNIVTGTFSLNIMAMLPMENQIKRFVLATRRPVVYSIDLSYTEDSKIPYALHLQAWDQHDRKRLSLDAVMQNTEPGYDLNYSTGDIIAVDLTQ